MPLITARSEALGLPPRVVLFLFLGRHFLSFLHRGLGRRMSSTPEDGYTRVSDTGSVKGGPKDAGSNSTLYTPEFRAEAVRLVRSSPVVARSCSLAPMDKTPTRSPTILAAIRKPRAMPSTSLMRRAFPRHCEGVLTAPTPSIGPSMRRGPWLCARCFP